LFLANTENTTPVFTPRVAGASLRSFEAPTWEGSPLYRVYYTLREYVYPRDEGVVDRSNLYKLLFNVDTIYSDLYSMESVTEQSITPPFAQERSILCDQAINNTAVRMAGAKKETTAQVNAVVTWIWGDPATQEEYGIATIAYDQITGNITVELTYSVDYDPVTPATDYNLRCWVSGNTAANAFQYKYLIGSQAIVGQGISRGAGNYMLFKYSVGVDTNYIVVPGDANEDYFIAQNTSGSNIYADPALLPASVEAYRDWVRDATFFTTGELVSSLNQLNIGNTWEGTIYLDYQP
jgi:hypothetical protein